MLKMILLVPVIMVCATGGTVGLMKLVKKISPNGELPKDPIVRMFEGEDKKNDQK